MPNAVSPAPSLSRKRLLLIFAVYCLALGLLFLLGTEVALRLLGQGPSHSDTSESRIEPGGKLYTGHPTLGYTLLPGQFKVTLPSSYTFTMTHLPEGRRITRPFHLYNGADEKEEIWIFGCSFTYGWSLNDDETYAWTLQKSFPDYDIVNFGTSGYNTLQSFLQFLRALESKRKLKFVIVAYAHFHDERNTFIRSWRKKVSASRQIGRIANPYARLREDSQLVYGMAEMKYAALPFSHSLALMHVFENLYNEIEKRFSHSHQVTEMLLKRFAQVAKDHEIELVIAGILDSRVTRKMLRYAKSEGMPVVDMSVNLKVKENTNDPHDPHPSGRANEQFAAKLAAFLKDRSL